MDGGGGASADGCLGSGYAGEVDQLGVDLGQLERLGQLLGQLQPEVIRAIMWEDSRMNHNPR